MTCSSVDACPTVKENRQIMLAQNLATPATIKMHKFLFGLSERFFDRRVCPEGITTQILRPKVERAAKM